MTDLVWTDVRNIIEASIINAPRSLQTRIGPSELGNPCDRCLAHKLAGTPERPEAAWLPFIGTAVHEKFEGIFLGHEFTRADLGMPGRWLPEHRVTVGTVNGIEITGNTDLFDTQTGTVIDFKCVGTTTIKKAKAHGASLVYSRQAQLYAKGWADDGYTVNTTTILYLPRNSVSLADTYVWSAPYDRQIALDAIGRANLIAVAIAANGLEAVLAGMAEHTFEEFSCKRFATPIVNNTTSSAPFGALV